MSSFRCYIRSLIQTVKTGELPQFDGKSSSLIFKGGWKRFCEAVQFRTPGPNKGGLRALTEDLNPDKHGPVLSRDRPPCVSLSRLKDHCFCFHQQSNSCIITMVTVIFSVSYVVRFPTTSWMLKKVNTLNLFCTKITVFSYKFKFQKRLLCFVKKRKTKFCLEFRISVFRKKKKVNLSKLASFIKN